VDIILAVIGALDDSTVGSIVGSVISTLRRELSVFLFVSFSFDDDRSMVVGSISYMPLISILGRGQEGGGVMEHFPFRNIFICQPKSNWLINRQKCRKVGVWRAST